MTVPPAGHVDAILLDREDMGTGDQAREVLGVSIYSFRPGYAIVPPTWMCAGETSCCHWPDVPALGLRVEPGRSSSEQSRQGRGLSSCGEGSLALRAPGHDGNGISL